jgi:hypothetical protein
MRWRLNFAGPVLIREDARREYGEDGFRAVGETNGDILHVVFAWRGDVVRERWEAFNANVALIEDKASGTQLIQELVAEGLHAVTRYQPQPTRSCACTPRRR